MVHCVCYYLFPRTNLGVVLSLAVQPVQWTHRVSVMNPSIFAAGKWGHCRSKLETITLACSQETIQKSVSTYYPFSAASNLISQPVLAKWKLSQLETEANVKVPESVALTDAKCFNWVPFKNHQLFPWNTKFFIFPQWVIMVSFSKLCSNKFLVVILKSLLHF